MGPRVGGSGGGVYGGTHWGHHDIIVAELVQRGGGPSEPLTPAPPPRSTPCQGIMLICLCVCLCVCVCVCACACVWACVIACVFQWTCLCVL